MTQTFIVTGGNTGLGFQCASVLGADRAGALGLQAEEGLGGLRVRAQAGASYEVALGCEPDGCAGREHAEGGAEDPGGGRGRPHEWTPITGGPWARARRCG